MELKRVIKGKIEKCFALLEDACLEDIKASTEEETNTISLHAGYTYRKVLKTKMGVSGHVDVEITEFEAPKHYSAAFSSAQGINTITYELTQIDDDSMSVHYVEDFVSLTKSKNLNYKIMSKLYKKSTMKRANMLLDQLENLMNL